MTPHPADSIIQSFLFRYQNVLEGLPPEALATVQENMAVKTFEQGKDLFVQGNYAKGAFHLKSGLVKVAHGTPNGQRQLVYIYTPGDWIGYRQIITQEQFPVTATAIGNVETAFINARDFIRLMNDYPRFSSNILYALSHEFSSWVNRLTIFSKFQIRARVAISLLLLHDRFMEVSKEPGVIYFSRSDLADFVGATVETTVRMLSEFKSSGWVAVKGRRIDILNMNALYDAVGEL